MSRAGPGHRAQGRPRGSSEGLAGVGRTPRREAARLLRSWPARAGMVELVDTQRSGRCERTLVRVRFPFPAPDVIARLSASGFIFELQEGAGVVIGDHRLHPDTGPLHTAGCRPGMSTSPRQDSAAELGAAAVAQDTCWRCACKGGPHLVHDRALKAASAHRGAGPPAGAAWSRTSTPRWRGRSRRRSGPTRRESRSLTHAGTYGCPPPADPASAFAARAATARTPVRVAPGPAAESLTWPLSCPRSAGCATPPRGRGGRHGPVRPETLDPAPLRRSSG